MAKSTTWSHPDLGKFEFEDDAWVTTVRAPGFDAFRYDTDDGDRPAGKYELSIAADDEGDTPSPAAIKLALQVLADPPKLVAAVTKALWNDFNGRGPDSGMWWHDGLDEVAEMMEDEADLPPPKGPDDLLKAVGLYLIAVRKEAKGYDKPVVELCFYAAFEPEHNVGVLTDGRKVLGTGYYLDVSPFESE